MLGFYSGTSAARNTFPISVSGAVLHLNFCYFEFCGVCIFTLETLPGLGQAIKFKVVLNMLSKSECLILIKVELDSTVR